MAFLTVNRAGAIYLPIHRGRRAEGSSVKATQQPERAEAGQTGRRHIPNQERQRSRSGLQGPRRAPLLHSDFHGLQDNANRLTRPIKQPTEALRFFQMTRRLPPSMGICAPVVPANTGPHNSAASAATCLLVISIPSTLFVLYFSTVM